jgi:ABC-type multidrug transport system fused ATPase/permease subunit
MQVAFEEVRAQIANMNSFVQERVTGMKIVQLFTREVIEADKFRDINNKAQKKAWIKTILYNSIFFPIADIISSLTLGFIVLYGGMKGMVILSPLLGFILLHHVYYYVV